MAGFRHWLHRNWLRDRLDAEHQQHLEIVALHVRYRSIRISGGHSAGQLWDEPHRSPVERDAQAITVLPAAGAYCRHRKSPDHHVQMASPTYLLWVAGNHYRRE